MPCLYWGPGRAGGQRFQRFAGLPVAVVTMRQRSGGRPAILHAAVLDCGASGDSGCWSLQTPRTAALSGR